jgi:2-C-methyl-D-erythritol 4-phosphate cytidylyltransferase
MQVSVIIPAAGRSQRFGGSQTVSKIERPLNGKAVLMRAAELFLARDAVKQVLIAVPPDQLETLQLRWGDQLAFMGGQLIAGGERERWETVARALASVDADCTHIAVHDAARPLATRAMLDRVFQAAAQYQAVVPGVTVRDTLKRVGAQQGGDGAKADGESTDQPMEDPFEGLLGPAAGAEPTVWPVVTTVPRQDLMAIQTPQVFEAELLRRAYATLQTDGDNPSITDDASLVEAMGETVHVVAGETTNFKLTHPEDATLAEAVLAQRENIESDRMHRPAPDDDEDDLF